MCWVRMCVKRLGQATMDGVGQWRSIQTRRALLRTPVRISFGYVGESRFHRSHSALGSPAIGDVDFQYSAIQFLYRCLQISGLISGPVTQHRFVQDRRNEALRRRL